MFDYALLERPMLFFTYDLEFYKNNLRDFYFNMEEVPGPLVKTTKGLIEEIKEIEKGNYESKYKEKYDAFIKKFNEFDDGNACKSIIELMKSNKH